MSVYKRKDCKGWHINFTFQGVRINCIGGRTKKEAKETEEELRTKLRLKMLNISDIKDDGSPNNFVVWDSSSNAPVVYDSSTTGYKTSKT